MTSEDQDRAQLEARITRLRERVSNLRERVRASRRTPSTETDEAAPPTPRPAEHEEPASDRPTADDGTVLEPTLDLP